MKLSYIVLIVFFVIGASELKSCEYVETEHQPSPSLSIFGVK